MLTQEEQNFIQYWETARTRKQRWFRQFSIGLPLGVLIVLALAVNMFSGWNRRADMVLRSNSSLIITVVVAAVGIVVFTTIFAQKHQLDQNEQRYQELLRKKKEEEEGTHRNNETPSI